MFGLDDVDPLWTGAGSAMAITCAPVTRVFAPMTARQGKIH